MDQTAPQIVTEVRPPDLELTLTRNAWYNPISFEAASWIVRHLPRHLSRSLSVGIGELGYRLCNSRRAALLRNLEAITPDECRRKVLSRSCFNNFLRMLHDFCDCAEGGADRVNSLMVERR